MTFIQIQRKIWAFIMRLKNPKDRFSTVPAVKFIYEILERKDESVFYLKIYFLEIDSKN